MEYGVGNYPDMMNQKDTYAVNPTQEFARITNRKLYFQRVYFNIQAEIDSQIALVSIRVRLSHEFHEERRITSMILWLHWWVFNRIDE